MTERKATHIDYGQGSKPSEFVSEGHLEIEDLNSLDDFREACKRQRKKQGMVRCLRCYCDTPQGTCWRCGSHEFEE